ncbi:hypothetical protein QUA83_02065 [Microcoleus sp. K1-B1]
MNSCQNSLVGEAAGGKPASCKGFFRLTADDFCENAIATIQ